MSEQEKKPKRPEFFNGVRVRMPEDYDFNTWGKDYSEYDKDYTLRTDAVWEKQQLKDWFRLTNKVFFFNVKDKKYQFIEPQDIYNLVFEPWGFQDDEVMNWSGYSKTGATTSFQSGVGPKQRVQTTFNSFYSMPDYYIMCAMRFQKWYNCDSLYGKNRTRDFDRNPDHYDTPDGPVKHTYPCFREFYEANYACADNIMKFLVQLSYHKKAAGFYSGNYNNSQMKGFATIFDSASSPESTVTYTY